MRARAILIAAGLALAALPAPAQAGFNVYRQVESVYQRDGTVPPCRFSSAWLSTTLKRVDTYAAQYFADFTNAVQAALTARASGACSHGTRTQARPSGPIPAGGSLPASVTSPTDSGLPGPLLLLGALTLLAALGALLFAGLRLSGWTPRWTAAWGHAFAEAGYRLNGRWENARDRWRRPGR